MANICQQPLEKRMRTKRLRQADFKVEHMPADDLPRHVDYLHTIARIGKAPLSPQEVKQVIIEYRDREGKLPTTIETTSQAVNRSVGVIVPDIGYVHIRFKPGKRFKVY